MKASIQFGSKTIEYQLAFSVRKTLGITVNPDLSVLIKAPVNTPMDKIEEKIRKRAPWIIKQQSHFLSFYPKAVPKNYVSGETHLYLGRQYRLKVSEAKQNDVKLKGKYILVDVAKKSTPENVLNHWYLENARIKFETYAVVWIEKFKKYNVAPTNIIMLEMPTRWGSCTPKGKIILNPELIKAPKGCIEYVIVHELCHLVYHDHTQKFLDLQTKEMPMWEKWKLKLEMLLA
jgi:predicted metal-dependent hydrolase